MIFLKKLQIRHYVFKGEITVFLSLIFVLMLSLVGALIEGTNIQILKFLKQSEMNMAIESVFAEYEKMILERYDLFIRSGYDERVIVEKLAYYGADDMEHRIVKAELLTDFNGREFYRQAVASMGGSISGERMLDGKMEIEGETEIRDTFQSLLLEQGQDFVLENNPLELLQRFTQSNLLTFVFPSQEKLSEKIVKLENLPSGRKLETGTGDITESPKTGAMEKALFVEYLMEHFQMFTQELSPHPFEYEAEYLLSGCGSDKENLEFVAGKILTLRAALNYGYLLTDQTKQMEAETMALTISSLLPVPGSTEVIKQTLLLAWAYGESILDVRVLLKGEKIPFFKTSDTWQLQLKNLEKLGTSSEVYEEQDSMEGNSYEDYIRAFLAMEDIETLSVRALDVIELNTGIEMDQCVTALEIQTTCQLRGGKPFTFLTNYKYE